MPQVYVDAVLEEVREQYYVLRTKLLGRVFYPIFGLVHLVTSVRRVVHLAQNSSQEVSRRWPLSVTSRYPGWTAWRRKRAASE